MAEAAWKWPPGSVSRHWYPDGETAACGAGRFTGTPTPPRIARISAPGPTDCHRCWDVWRLGAGPAPTAAKEASPMPRIECA